jgi:hypothetical protein
MTSVVRLFECSVNIRTHSVMTLFYAASLSVVTELPPKVTPIEARIGRCVAAIARPRGGDWKSQSHAATVHLDPCASRGVP